MTDNLFNSGRVRLLKRAEENVIATKSVLLPTHKLFDVTKIVAVILAVINFVLMLATIFGLILTLGDMDKTHSQYTALVYDIRITAILLVLIILCVIFIKFKKYILAGAFGLLEALIFIPNQSLDFIFADNNLRIFLLFTLPTALFGLCALYIIISSVIYKLRVKSEYDNLSRKFIATYSSRSDGEITTEEQWSAYIDEFLSEPVHAKPKKSLRQKARKNNKEA